MTELVRKTTAKAILKRKQTRHSFPEKRFGARTTKHQKTKKIPTISLVGAYQKQVTLGTVPLLATDSRWQSRAAPGLPDSTPMQGPPCGAARASHNKPATREKRPAILAVRQGASRAGASVRLNCPL